MKVYNFFTRISPLILACIALGLSLFKAFPEIQSLGWWLLSIQLPGTMLLLLVTQKSNDLPPLETWILGGAIGYGLSTVTLLIISFTASSFSTVLLLIIFGLETFILSGWVALRHGDILEGRLFRIQLPRTAAAWFGVVLLVILAVLYLVGLGYSEYQGDELDAIEPALAILSGDSNVLLSHQKGPTQSLVAASFVRILDSYLEGPMRLPYALAGLWAAGALYLLTRHWFGNRTALIALALYALSGLTLGFSRIVQYQGMLLLAQIASLICFVNFSRAKNSGQAMRWLVLGAFLLGYALLTHYEAFFVGVVSLPLLWQGRNNLSGRAQWGWGIAGIIFLLMVVYYIPFFTADDFSETAAHYQTNRIHFERLPHNNLTHFVRFNLFYNSIYAFLILILAALTGLWLAMRSATNRIWWINLSLVAFILGLVILAIGGKEAPFPAIIIGGSLLLPMILTVILLPKISPTYRVLGIWLFSYWFTYTFLIGDPGLHYYDAVAPWVIWAAVGIDWFITKIPSPVWYKIRYAIVFLWGFLIIYPILGFVFVEQEMLLTLPESSSLIRLWTPIPVRSGGLFGVPHREGWAGVAALYREGVLVGDYASNGGNVVPRWYVGTKAAKHEWPTYLFVTDRLYQKTHQKKIEELLSTGRYHQIAAIMTDNRELNIYQVDAQENQALGTWDLTELISRYNQSIDVDETIETQKQAIYWKSAARFMNSFVAPDTVVQVCPAAALPLLSTWVQSPLQLEPGCNIQDATWQVQQIDLFSGNRGWVFGDVEIIPPANDFVSGLYWKNFQEGIQLVGSNVTPNLDTNQMAVDLVWKRWSPPSSMRNYTAFIHLIDADGNLISQLDREIKVEDRDVWRWQIGEVVDTPMVMKLPSGMETGTYSLITGLYYWETGESLAVLSDSGEIGDTFLWLGDLQLQEGTAVFNYAAN